MMKRLDRGITLAEVLIASSVITVFVVALVGVYNLHLKIIFGASEEIKASYLAEEGVEAIKFLRNDSWDLFISPLTIGSDHFITWQTDRWVTTGTNTYIDGLYERKIILNQVLRNSEDDIVESGGSVDDSARKVTVTVSWRDGNATSTKSVSTYITDIFDN